MSISILDRRARDLVFAKHILKSQADSRVSHSLIHRKISSKNESEREHGVEDDGSLGGRRKSQSPEAEIGPMTTNRKSDRIGRLGLGKFFNATRIFELFV